MKKSTAKKRGKYTPHKKAPVITSEKIKSDVEKFLKDGGEITEIEIGESGVPIMRKKPYKDQLKI